jgi:DNA-binding MarR family transcriptional regulator
MEKLERIIFYKLDKAIKTYRQFAQRRMNDAGLAITIDQWLVLHAIEDKPGIAQLEIAELVFKDAASVTRIVELLTKKGYLQRQENKDRRRYTLQLTNEGKEMTRQVNKIAEQNRSIALNGISEKELQKMNQLLITIIDNCQ